MSYEEGVEGLTFLCFFDDSSWFQGILLTKDKKQYGILGEVCNPPEEGFAECCFEDVPVFYQITVIDYETKDEKVFNHVMKTGGDNCILTSNVLNFETEELLVGSKADKHVMKYCRPELRGKEAIVCSGHLVMRCGDQADG